MSLATVVIALICAVPIVLLVVDVARGRSRRPGPQRRTPRRPARPEMSRAADAPADATGVPPIHRPAAAARPRPPKPSRSPRPPVSPYVLLRAR
ncbi:MAG: hypothetical protein IRZ32_08015 [Solirubrobacteraceae bacterium]|nr:hypothetical protein [Solirubrobacteraceae bacterium]